MSGFQKKGWEWVGRTLSSFILDFLNLFNFAKPLMANSTRSLVVRPSFPMMTITSFMVMMMSCLVDPVEVTHD